MMTASLRFAQSRSARRRASGRIAPVGNWCEGVTKATRAACGSLARIEAVAIYWHRKQAGSCSAEIFRVCLDIAVFDGDGVAAFDEDARDQVERLLRAVDDDHLRGIADDRAGATDMDGDGSAQREASGGGAVVEFAHRSFAGMAQENAAPHFEGESVHVAAPAVSEIVAERNRAAAGEIHGGGDTRGRLAVTRSWSFADFF